MRICIHRGSKQIGGSCVELESNGKRIIIDFGLPLDAESDGLQYLPEIQGLNGEDESLLGILVSHPHLDHFGLLNYVNPEILVGMGVAARRILMAAAPFLTENWVVPKSGWDLENGKSLSVGPFVVTPFLVDHSAYDAYSFLIEVEEKRIVYSGDFRAHGRKSALFERFINRPHPETDVILLEGSTLGRLDEGKKFPSEADIETELLNVFRKTEGMVLVHTSVQNIDRVVSIFRACKRSGRKLLIDLYTAAILEATGNPNIPQSNWDEISLFIPQYQRIQIKNNAWFDLLKKHSSHRIFIESLKDVASRSVLLFRPVHIRDLEKANCLKGSAYIYSQWEGYWSRESYAYLRSWIESQNIPRWSIHTSGHASIADLQQFVAVLSPRKVVPIHTFMPERYPVLFPNVEFHNDGEWWEI